MDVLICLSYHLHILFYNLSEIQITFFLIPEFQELPHRNLTLHMSSHICNPLLPQMSFPHQYSDASTSALNLNDDSSTHSISLTHVSHEVVVGGNLDSHLLSLQFLDSIGLPNVQSTIIPVSLQSHNPLRYASYFFRAVLTRILTEVLYQTHLVLRISE